MNVKNTDIVVTYRTLVGNVTDKRPAYIFNRERGLYDTDLRLFQVQVGIGFSAYCDWVFAANEQDALDYLADALDDDAIPQEQPWLAQAKIDQDTIDHMTDEDHETTEYVSLGNAGEYYDLSNVAIIAKPYSVIIEVVETA